MIEVMFTDGPLSGTTSKVSCEVLNKMRVFIFQERPYVKCIYKLNEDLTANFLGYIK